MWIRYDGKEHRNEKRTKGFTADFRPPPPEIKAQLNASKSAPAVKRYLIRQN
jgi:hypothetical protein